MSRLERLCNTTHPCCNRNDSKAIYDLSRLCVNGSNVNGSYDCFDQSFEHCPYRKTLAVWAVSIMFIGVVANLITLLSIRYAAKKKR